MELAVAPLVGRYVRLEPLTADLGTELARALDGHDDDWGLMTTRANAQGFAGWWNDALDAMACGARVAYAVRLQDDGAVVGTTSFLEISRAHRRVEIGATFLSASARGGAVNPDMKFAMLTHAFAAGAVRVELVTDARNVRSRAALAKLGAAEEGVLRRHKITWTGHIRDTVMFAVTDQDWPGVRAGLEARLDRLAAGAP